MTNKQTIDGVSRAALEALKSAKLFISNGIDLGFIRMPDAETPDPAHDTLPMMDKAIEELRALLDKPSQSDYLDSCAAAASVFAELATQPQGEVERLRAELAERDALLRELDDAWNSHDGKPRFGKLMAKVEALSTSAEPKP